MPATQDRDIVCFSNDWNGDPLSKTHLMRVAARTRRILWVDSTGNRSARATPADLRRMARKLWRAARGVREVEPNLHVLSPIAAPFPGAKWAHGANGRIIAAQVRAAMQRMGMTDPVALSYLPSSAPAIDLIGASSIVYHCVDDFPAFRGAGARIERLERELVAKSDLVIASAYPLAVRLERLHPNVELVRHGVDHAHFARALEPGLAMHPLVRDLPKPVIGFVGLVEDWVDLGILEALARSTVGSLLVVGKVAVDVARLRSLGNVVFTGRQAYGELPSILKGVDVGVCPFRDGRLARGANPLKVREYLAAGLPVVSTPIPEVAQLPHTTLASGAEAFIRAVEEAYVRGRAGAAERSESVRDMSWESRWSTIEGLIERHTTPMPSARADLG